MEIHKYDEVIIKYLEGNLSKSEEKAFEAELQNNEALRSAFNFHLRLDKVVASREADSKYEDYLESFKPAKKSILKNKYYLAAAALIIILLALAFLLFSMSGTKLSEAELYANYYTSYDLNENYRSADDLPLEKGLALYNAGNYADALSYFEGQLTAKKVTAKSSFIAGISALELDMPEKAVTYFGQVLQAENLEFYQHAQWYLALAYLKINDQTKAKVLLKALSNSPGFYHEKAKNLLEELN